MSREAAKQAQTQQQFGAFSGPGGVPEVYAPPWLFGGGATGTANVGYQNLLNILQGQGRTDPSWMNQILSDIQRNTQGNQQQAQGLAARQGFMNSGVNAAIQASLGQAGASKQADVVAREAQMAEQRKRGDLDLIISMLLNPQLQWSSLQAGQGAQNLAMARQSGGGFDLGSALGSLLGFGGMALGGGIFGGGG